MGNKKWTGKDAVYQMGEFMLRIHKTGASHGLTLAEAIGRYRALSPTPAKIRPTERKKVRMTCPMCAITFEGFPAPREGRVSLLIQYNQAGHPALFKEVEGRRIHLGPARRLIHPANIPALDPDMPRRWFHYRGAEFKGNRIVRFDPDTQRTRLLKWDGHKSVSPRAKPE